MLCESVSFADLTLGNREIFLPSKKCNIFVYLGNVVPVHTNSIVI